jgi:cyclophilin family peptidyl-prolyl cis-trans isomerase
MDYFYTKAFGRREESTTSSSSSLPHHYHYGYSEPQLQDRLPSSLHKKRDSWDSSSCSSTDSKNRKEYRGHDQLGDYFFGSPTTTPIIMSSVKEDELCLPTWSANPQSAEDDDLSISTLVCTARKRKSLLSLVILIFSIVGVTLYWQSRSKLDGALAEVGSMMAASQRMDMQMKAAERNVRMLQRELVALNMMEEHHAGNMAAASAHDQVAADINPKAVDEMNLIQDRLRASAERAEALKLSVQTASRNDVIAKYGAGVHRVQMELVFPGNLDGPKIFVMEMAPVDIMPHSVHTFLEMVSAGLLDGCSFILNALHVLKAAPLPYDGSSASEKARAFTKQGLESVAFREYSHDYPHQRYTVGFAADGSPSFYINTEDNTEIHAGDPCFAKVVSGFDTMRRLEASPTRNGIWFEHRIGIKSAVVLE